MAEKLTGTVTRFNSVRGYGFITLPVDGENMDIFVHQSSIHCQGYRTLNPGQSVEFYVTQGTDGKYKAVEVKVLGVEVEEKEVEALVEEKDATPINTKEDTKEEDDMMVGKKFTGKVMRFDSTKGYGFIKAEEGGNEVFVHQTSILCEGFRTLNTDESVEFFVTKGKDGRIRADNVTVLGRKSKRETVECRTCGEVGHYSRECAQNVSGNCRTCGGVGHMAKDCPSPIIKKEPVVCYTCNRSGHISRDCKKGAKEKASGGGGGKASGGNGGGKASGGNGGGKASGGSGK